MQAPKDMLAALKKGSAESKIETYRSLIIGYSNDDAAMDAMIKQLGVESNGKVFKAVKRLDKVGGPRLDWAGINRLRLQKCNNANERYDALSADQDYGPDERSFLEQISRDDADINVRRRALEVLIIKHKGSDDTSLVSLAKQFLDNETLPEVDRSMLRTALTGLAHTPELIAFFEDALRDVTPDTARNLGGELGAMHSGGTAYDGKIIALCQAYNDALAQNGTAPSDPQDTDGLVLYRLVARFCDHRSFDPDFMRQVTQIALGPMLDAAKAHDANGWALLRSVRDMLARSQEHRVVANGLLYEIVTADNVLERERGFAVPFYVRSCRSLDMSDADIGEKLAPLTDDPASVVAQAVSRALNPNSEKLAAAENARLQRVEKMRRNALTRSFAEFILPFGMTYDFDGLLSKVNQAVEKAEKTDGATVLQAFIDATKTEPQAMMVLTLDRQDSSGAFAVIEASQHFLKLPTDQDIYPDDSLFTAPVDDQFAQYAVYLRAYDLHLAYIDAGWDDPCAVVLAKPDAFKAFLAEQLPDLTCTVFA